MSKRDKKEWTKTVEKLPETYAGLPTDKPIHIVMELQSNGAFVITSPEVPALLTEATSPYAALKQAGDALQLVNAYQEGRLTEPTPQKRSTARRGRGV